MPLSFFLVFSGPLFLLFYASTPARPPARPPATFIARHARRRKARRGRPNRKRRTVVGPEGLRGAVHLEGEVLAAHCLARRSEHAWAAPTRGIGIGIGGQRFILSSVATGAKVCSAKQGVAVECTYPRVGLQAPQHLHDRVIGPITLAQGPKSVPQKRRANFDRGRTGLGGRRTHAPNARPPAPHPVLQRESRSHRPLIPAHVPQRGVSRMQ